MKRPLLLLPCLAILAALALTACGGGGDSGSGDEGKIEATIETAATSSDPSNCTKLQTRQFDEQTTGTEGAGAVKECERETEGEQEKAESVDVSKVSVDGEEATAEAAFKGGSFEGQALELGLTKEGDNWLLNEVLGFTKFDAKQLAKTFQAGFEESGELEPELVTCLSEAFGSISKSEAEEVMFGGSQEPIEELVEGCQ